jgi:hypothetical protein
VKEWERGTEGERERERETRFNLEERREGKVYRYLYGFRGSFGTRARGRETHPSLATIKH